MQQRVVEPGLMSGGSSRRIIFLSTRPRYDDTPHIHSLDLFCESPAVLLGPSYAIAGAPVCSGSEFLAFGYKWEMDIVPQRTSSAATAQRVVMRLKVLGVEAEQSEGFCRQAAVPPPFMCDVQLACRRRVISSRTPITFAVGGMPCTLPGNGISAADVEAFIADNNGVIDISCSIWPPTVNLFHRVVPFPSPPPALGSDLISILKSSRGADVTFVCRSGEKIAAHSQILSARSPVFAALLSREHNLAKADLREVPVPEEIHPQVFRTLLEHVYSDAVTEPSSAEEARIHRMTAPPLPPISSPTMAQGVRWYCCSECIHPLAGNDATSEDQRPALASLSFLHCYQLSW